VNKNDVMSDQMV